MSARKHSTMARPASSVHTMSPGVIFSAGGATPCRDIAGARQIANNLLAATTGRRWRSTSLCPSTRAISTAGAPAAAAHFTGRAHRIAAGLDGVPGDAAGRTIGARGWCSSSVTTTEREAKTEPDGMTDHGHDNAVFRALALMPKTYRYGRRIFFCDLPGEPILGRALKS